MCWLLVLLAIQYLVFHGVLHLFFWQVYWLYSLAELDLRDDICSKSQSLYMNLFSISIQFYMYKIGLVNEF